MDQKWILDGGIYFPVDGNTKIHITPGNGVFELIQIKSPSGVKTGLKYLSDKFNFDFKIYDVGCDDFINSIKNTWESDYFIRNNRNLGVILNGFKGTGKTIAAKILCNSIGIPVIIIPDSGIEGMTSFIQQLNFECAILIDEAEKTFKKGEDDEILLKLIDGVYNRARKLYILTTNKLDLNENLLGRPGRIRYIKQFGNLSEKAVSDVIDDNLQDKSKKESIIQIVDLLEISTIDILKNIIEEVNIHGTISEDSYLNIPKAKYTYDIIKFRDVDDDKIAEIKSLFKDITNVREWLNSPFTGEFNNSLNNEEGVDDNDCKTNEDWIYNKYDGYIDKLSTSYSSFWRGCETSIGTIAEDIDENGFISIKGWYGDEYLCKILKKRNNPSLYRGSLVF